jgi:cold shock CspA family protein
VSQATVRTWDAETGGTVFLDDGTVVVITREALQDSVFRLLRPGQRVQLELLHGVVVAVGLP